jgi:bifunctional DNA-binding transcriptional regulator/antitoxin component of YhaV-PrlF toxin-antitoxin module
MGKYSFFPCEHVVVEIDERGRVTIPKEMRVGAEKALGDFDGRFVHDNSNPQEAPLEFDMDKEETGKSAKKRAERKLAGEAKARTKPRRLQK